MLEVQEHLRMKQTLYETKEKWDISMGKWYSAPLFSLNIAQVRKEVTAFIRTVDNLEKSKKKSPLLYMRSITYTCTVNSL